MEYGKPLDQFAIGEIIETKVDGFEKLEIVEKYPSRNRWVAKVKSPKQDHHVLKVLGESIRLKPADITQLTGQIRKYRLELVGHDVHVPGKIVLARTKRRRKKQTRHFLLEFSPYHGESLATIIERETDVTTVIQFVTSALNQLSELFHNSRGQLLPVGIDMVPRNFTVNGDGLAYVDLMPPKIWHERQRFHQICTKPLASLWQYVTLEYPPVNNMVAGGAGFLRHFTKTGVLTVWLTHLAKLRPDLYPQFDNAISDWLERRGDEETLEDFRSRPAARTIVSGDVERLTSLVTEAKTADVYLLREAACYLAHHGHLSDVTPVFELTHFLQRPLPNTNLARAKRIILDASKPASAEAITPQMRASAAAV